MALQILTLGGRRFRRKATDFFVTEYRNRYEARRELTLIKCVIGMLIFTAAFHQRFFISQWRTCQLSSWFSWLTGITPEVDLTLRVDFSISMFCKLTLNWTSAFETPLCLQPHVLKSLACTTHLIFALQIRWLYITSWRMQSNIDSIRALCQELDDDVLWHRKKPIEWFPASRISRSNPEDEYAYGCLLLLLPELRAEPGN